MIRRIGLLSAIGLIGALAPPAAASVTIGQTEPGAGSCATGYDWVQPTVTSGNTYVVPPTVATGAITSWSTTANTNGGMMTMKVFRQVSGLRYMAVGHDVPRPLTPGVLNSFTGLNVPVKAGDLLGLHAGPGATDCISPVAGDTSYYLLQDLADGQSGDFAPDVPDRLNITASISPSNAFNPGAVTRNRKKGTANLALNLPNPGELTASGNGVKAASGALTSKSVGAGEAQLLIKAKGKKKRKLNETGKVKLNVAVTYTPTGGDPSSQSVKVKLKKKL
jgi:hypothetical protein